MSTESTTQIHDRLRRVQDSSYEFLSNRRIMIGLTVVPPLLLFLFINIFPIFWSIAASFHRISAFSPEWTYTGLSNYFYLFSQEAFRQSMWRSAIYAGSSVVLQLVAGVAMALVLARDFKFAKIARAVSFLPYLVPTAIFSYLAIWMTNPSWGIINWLLMDIGLLDQPTSWFGEPGLAMPALVVAGSWKFSVFVMVMVIARLQSIPEGFYEAANMAGANRYQRFRDITLPNLKSIIFITLLLRFIWMFIKFDVVNILTGGGPGGQTTTAAIYAYQTAFQSFMLGRAAAISTVLFGLLAVFAVVYFLVFQPEQAVRVE